MTEPAQSTADSSTTSRTRKGVVGMRDLIGIQTFDVARLTTHSVPLIPGVFIAVSGIGPEGDSNGSGKTSFLSAASVLLADPQWRLDVNGGKHAAGLLFKPDSAGVDPAQEMPAAPYGYIVGVFGARAEQLNDLLTVWVRVSSTSPYVEARWRDGLHVADADTDAERVLQADDLWLSCPAGCSASARRMAETLYGDAPRCLTYLDTPLRPAIPSLLSQQMTEMDPDDIGVSLIALTGLGSDLATEATLRSQYLEKDRELAEAVASNVSATAEEEIDLAGVRAREAARAHIASGRQAWRQYIAVRLNSAREADTKLEAELRERRELQEQAHAAVEECHAQLANLPKQADLQKDEQKRNGEWSQLRNLLEEHRISRTALSTRQSQLSAEKTSSRAEADGWSGATVEQAEKALSDAWQAQSDARAEEAEATRRAAAAEDYLRLTLAGLAGRAGQAIELLRGRNIESIGLLDAAEFPQDIRGVWEARLWPWRDAVVVAAEDADDARDLLAAQLPGAQAVAAGACPERTPLRQRGRDALVEFFDRLEGETSTRGAEGDVQYTGLGISVSGGFEPPVAGREARVKAARLILDQAQDALAKAVSALTLAGTQVTLAETNVKAAKAVVRLSEINSEMRDIATKISKIDETLGKLTAREAAAEEAWKKAHTELATRTQAVALANSNLRLALVEEKKRKETADAVEKRREALFMSAWLRAWGEGADAAEELINTELGGKRIRPESMKRACSESLLDALRDLGVDDIWREDIPDDLKDVVSLREQFSDATDANGPSIAFSEVSSPLLNRLAGAADGDRVIADRIATLRDERSNALEELRTEALRSADSLTSVQDMLERHIESILSSMSSAFNELDLARGGSGAKIEFSSSRPQGAGEWRWYVTPQWKRSKRGSMISYREVSHGAQVKVHAIMLVLAAMLADAEPEGRILVLDELGNSLGEVNRRETLSALHAVAQRKHVTILGTCQDSVLSDAADYCGELLWFEHSTNDHAYNQPTRAWAFDANSQRVELSSAWVRSGRPDV
jgi:hypothetical protein